MTSAWMLLMTAVAASTVLWPVGRWGLRGDGRATVMGFWISLTMGTVSLAGWLTRGPLHAPRGVWLAAALLGLAYSVGFCMLIMHCLKIGPAGPTVTINNLAMACGVLYDVLVLRPSGLPDWRILVGALGTCAALVLLGAGQRDPAQAATPVPKSWLPMVLIGGAFSGLSFITQTYVGRMHPGHGFAYLAIGSFESALVLAVMIARQPRPWKRPRERAAGLTIGAISGVGMLVTLAAFRHFSSAVVLPVTVVTPVVLVLLIGHFIYHERLGRLQAGGSVVGIGSLLLLTFGSA
jgi:drug/metabolite transporter (DMT)-like permease